MKNENNENYYYVLIENKENLPKALNICKLNYFYAL